VKAATDARATIEMLLEGMFSVQSVPRLYNENDVDQVGSYIVTVKLEPHPCMVLAAFEYLNMLSVIFSTFIKRSYILMHSTLQLKRDDLSTCISCSLFKRPALFICKDPDTFWRQGLVVSNLIEVIRYSEFSDSFAQFLQTNVIPSKSLPTYY
jgi:hypothetical protein